VRSKQRIHFSGRGKESRDQNGDQRQIDLDVLEQSLNAPIRRGRFRGVTTGGGKLCQIDRSDTNERDQQLRKQDDSRTMPAP